MIAARLLLALWLTLGAGAALAQTDLLSQVTGQGAPAEEPPAEEPAAETPSEEILPPEPGALAEVLPVFDDWNVIATRAEETLRRGDASAFTLDRLWDELFDWRDRFEALDGKNAQRIRTLNNQIAALATQDGTEAPEIIAARQAELEAQRADLLAPRLLAQEAFARANGLIDEVDTALRNRDFAAVTRRGLTPLNPALWPDGINHLGEVFSGIGAETRAAFVAARNRDDFSAMLPRSVLMILVGLALLTIGRETMGRWDERQRDDRGRGPVAKQFALALLSLLLPAVGLVLVINGIARLELLGVLGQALLVALPAAGVTAIVAWWLSLRFFPSGHRLGPLHYAPERRRELRRAGLTLGLWIAFGILWEALVTSREVDANTLLVLLLPIHLVSGLLLFRFGQLLRQPPDAVGDEEAPVSVMRGIFGRGIMAIGIVAPLLAALGYGNATQALITPAVQTLAVLGIVILLQDLVRKVFALRPGREDDDAGPLAPILIGFGFLLLSLPVLALIWGARASDLLQLWARFRTGFALGDARISPTVLLTFFVVFAIGYIVTRFMQGALRGSVLPRTRLDIGAQNAVVSGFGYVGITLAALIAITSAGIDLSSLAIVAGALSVGIGFGLQTVVSNFVSGIILLIERPVSEGDWIEINGQMGYVRDISVRSTRIETFDRTDVIVPNADLISQQVVNWTRGNSVGRAIVPVGVAYGSDVEKVMRILKEVAMEQPMVLHNPEPNIFFMGFGASSLDFEVRAILRDVNFLLPVKSDICVAIDKRFREEGIEIPFPQQDVYIKEMPDRDKATDD